MKGVYPAFIGQALRGELTIFGDGMQTRSFAMLTIK
jgi:nucleoside-diphosphate-sugar epimerase